MLNRLGIDRARQAEDVDTTEAIILIDKATAETIDLTAVTKAVMEAQPHRQVWVSAGRAKMAVRGSVVGERIAGDRSGSPFGPGET